ncbi:MAG: hypothetical protein ABJG75_09685 [Roseobacter sp.]
MLHQQPPTFTGFGTLQCALVGLPGHERAFFIGRLIADSEDEIRDIRPFELRNVLETQN